MGSIDYNEEAGRIAAAFVAARGAARALPAYPGRMPNSLAEAYAVQDAALALSDSVVAGWKVGRINPPIDAIDRLGGPIFAASVFAATPVLRPMPVFADGFAAAEAEFLLRIGTAPDPAMRHYSVVEAAALIDAVHVGIEIASSPFPGINACGPLVTISDFGNNNGLVVGAAIPDWRTAAILDWPVVLEINGTALGTGIAADMLDGPFGAARFLFESLAARGIALKPGDWISSGAVTGVHEVAAGDRVTARFGGGYAVECSIEAS